MNVATLLDVALERVARGESIIPIGRDKRPLVRWTDYQRKRPDEGQVRSWYRSSRPTGWGVVTGRISGFFVLDFDGPQGRETLDSLGLKPWLMTPRGGFHVRVRYPGERIPTLNGESDADLKRRWPGMDVRGDGGYEAFAGRTTAGEYQELAEPIAEDFGSLPDELRAFLLRRGADTNPQPQPQTTLNGGSSSVGAETVVKWALERATIGGRNEVGLKLACQLRDNRVSPADAESAMRAYAARVPQNGGDPYTAREALRSLAEAYKRPPREPWSTTDDSPKERQAPADQAPPPPRTDAGNAERLVLAHGETLRFVAGVGWYVWDAASNRWRADETGQPMRDMRNVARRMLEQALRLEDPEERKRAVAFALKSEDERKLKGAINLASSDASLVIQRHDVDSHPFLLACPNGTVNLRTGKLQAPNPADLLSRGTMVPFDPAAKAPRWERFLAEIFQGDVDLVSFVQKLTGYVLTGSTQEQIAAVFYGTGANGKSVMIATLRAMLGDLAASSPFDTFIRGRNDHRPRNDIARLDGARLVTASESGEGHRLDEAVIKEVTGGDTIAARFLHQEHFEFAPQFKLVLVTNHLPRVDGGDDAIWRRLRLVPFNESFAGREDRQLPGTLREELPGILAWAVRGCLDWQREGLGEAAAITSATRSYRGEEDSIGRFVEEACVREGTASVPEFYETYAVWCESNGMTPAAKRQVTRELRARFNVADARVAGVRRHGGISLIQPTTAKEAA